MLYNNYSAFLLSFNDNFQNNAPRTQKECLKTQLIVFKRFKVIVILKLFASWNAHWQKWREKSAFIWPFFAFVFKRSKRKRNTGMVLERWKNSVGQVPLLLCSHRSSLLDVHQTIYSVTKIPINQPRFPWQNVPAWCGQCILNQTAQAATVWLL